MAEIMAQQGSGLSAPTSRQDVVSALLSAYGNSFGRGDGSPSTYSPVPADKELPPPPPRSDSLQRKPLPAFQRAEERMSMKFQLRVDEDVPRSPNGTYQDPSQRHSRKRITYRSLSREAKPPSLTLKVSNGSTAIVPPTPPLPVRAQRSPVARNLDDKTLPSPPPPPPAKSDRRSAQPPVTSSPQSKPQNTLARNDSLLSQSEAKPAQAEAPAMTDMASVVKRKALPLPAVKKFKSLAELGAGRRGGKGGPLPPTSAPRKTSVDSQASRSSQGETSKPKTNESNIQSSEQPREPVTINRLPPTPDEEKFEAAPTHAPAPPRKAFVPIGLPSNPRAKGGPISPKHVRGKSSTGFNLLKAQRPAPPPPTKVETITPEMTPSPKLKPNDDPKTDVISPVSPLPAPREQPRPFSFEPIKTIVPQVEPAPQPPQAEPESQVPQVEATAPTPKLQPTPRAEPALRTPRVEQTSQSPQITVTENAPRASSPLAPPTEPWRPTSMDLASPLPAASPLPTTTSPLPKASPQPITTAPTQNLPPSPPAISIPQPSLPSPISEDPSTPPPFTPLTRAPQPLPPSLIPPITDSHLTCYTNHATSIWSNNAFQPMGCMICRSNAKDRKWTCIWCQLRICRECCDELMQVPGRDLAVVLEGRRRVVERWEGESGGL